MTSKYPITRCACGGTHPAGTEIAKLADGRWIAKSCTGRTAVVSVSTGTAGISRPRHARRSVAQRNYAATGDYYGSGAYDEES